MYQIKVTLHHAILSWLTMNCYICIVEEYRFTILLKREIFLIDFRGIAIVKIDMPIGTLYIYQINIVTLFIKERV